MPAPLGPTAAPAEACRLAPGPAVSERGGRQRQRHLPDRLPVGGGARLDGMAGAPGGNHGPREPSAIGAAPARPARRRDRAGDGRSNGGPAPGRVCARDDIGKIVLEGPAVGGQEADGAVRRAAEVIRGPGARAMPARTDADVPPAIRRRRGRGLPGPEPGGPFPAGGRG